MPVVFVIQGLPKPANLSHNRQTRNSFLLSKVDLTPDDVMYTSLPLYHSAAYTLGLTNVVRVGKESVLYIRVSCFAFNCIRQQKA